MARLHLHEAWLKNQTSILWVAVAVMAASAAVFLSYEFWRLLVDSSWMGAIDLKQRHEEMRCLFSGCDPYRDMSTSVYPPASYLMLWPFLGWMGVEGARWYWAITTVVLLSLLIYSAVRLSTADTPLLRAFAGLLVLSSYATGATIGNGQLSIHCITALVFAVWLLEGPEALWKSNMVAAGLFLLALVKPSIAAPFFWIVLLVPRTRVPALSVVGGYMALTLFAASFQQIGTVHLFVEWYRHAAAGLDWSAATRGLATGGHDKFGIDIYGATNVPGLLSTLGLDHWKALAVFLTLAGLGIWVYRYRMVDIWILAGVTGFVDRFWIYHRWYDDLVILLPMIALLRIAQQKSTRPERSRQAGILVVVATISMLAPGGLYLFPEPWNQVYVGCQILVWLSGLIFLLQQARLEKWVTVADGLRGKHETREAAKGSSYAFTGQRSIRTPR